MKKNIDATNTDISNLKTDIGKIHNINCIEDIYMMNINGNGSISALQALNNAIKDGIFKSNGIYFGTVHSGSVYAYSGFSILEGKYCSFILHSYQNYITHVISQNGNIINDIYEK